MTTTMTRAAVYLRISNDSTGQKLGVARQRDDCLALCASKGWDPICYTDNDISAASGKLRPAYEALLIDIADGKVGAVVSWDLDRLHRRPVELEHFMALADKHHIALATVSGQVDLSTPQGRLTARIKGDVAAHEIEQLRARCLRKWQQVAESGERKWTNLPFGFRKDGTPNPKTAPLVVRAYQDILAGASTSDIARQWDAAGVKGGRGRPWTGSQVGDFLRNPRNAGFRAHRGEILKYPEDHLEAGQRVRGQWTPLVDPAVWDEAMVVLLDPSRGFGHKTCARRWLLTGTMLCGRCRQRTLTGGSQSARNHPHSRYQGDDALGYYCKGCFGTYIRHGDVEPIIKELIARRLAAPDAADLLKTEHQDQQEAAKRREQRNTLTARLSSLADDYANGLLDGQQVKRATDLIRVKLGELDSRERDHVKVRAFADLPLGTAEVAEKLQTLSHDRFRAIMGLLLEVVIEPVPRARRQQPNPDRIKVAWK